VRVVTAPATGVRESVLSFESISGCDYLSLDEQGNEHAEYQSQASLLLQLEMEESSEVNKSPEDTREGPVMAVMAGGLTRM